MALITPVTDQTLFREWKEITNDLIDIIGNVDTLDTNDKSNTVNAINELKTDVDLNTSGVGDIGDITTLNTLDKSNTVNAINEIDADVATNTGLISGVDSDVGDITTLTTADKSSVVNAINELDVHVAPDVYFPNFDIGNFSDETGITATTFNSGNLFNTYNSSSLIEGQKFIDDNADNGGSGGSMGADANSLVSFLSSSGRTNLRYGYEFFIMDLTPGGGTADPITENSTDYYPTCSSLELYLGAIGDQVEWAGYVRNTDNSKLMLIGNNDADIQTYVDGVLQVTPLEVADTDGWIFVQQVITLTQEYKKLFPAISTETNADEVNVALSALYRAKKGIQHVGVVK